MANQKNDLVDALYWIGEEASANSNGYNLTDALVGIARALYAISDAIEKQTEAMQNRKPESPAADVRPGDFRL